MECLSLISRDWLDIIYTGELKIELDNIFEKLLRIQNITPKHSDWFNWCRFTDINNIHVIILGQDPYHKEGWAHGLSFSCLNKIPPSLRNIYKCLLKSNCIKNIPDHGNLTKWSEQGVLLLNVSLTTTIGKAGAHMKLWKPYMKMVLHKICKIYENRNKKLIFLLWGEFAQSFMEINDYHIYMKAIHPSPLAQNICEEKKFINCDHFTKTNIYLKNAGISIDWDPSHKLDTTEINKMINITPNHHIVFTDGSCYPNVKNISARAGYAAAFVSGEFLNKCIYGNLAISQYASNIRAEGMAIIRALEMICESKQDYSVTIISDCEFWINMIQIYMPTWDETKFKKQANYDLTSRMWLKFNDAKQNGVIKFIHMKSHNKSGWNKFPDNSFEKFCFKNNYYVDKMCEYARKNLQPGDEKIDIIN